MNVARQLERTRAAIARGRASETQARPLPSAPRAPRGGMRAATDDDAAEIGLCVRCGRSHDYENRRRLIRPMRDMEASEVAAAWPCFYETYRTDEAVERALFRDLAAVRAKKAVRR